MAAARRNGSARLSAAARRFVGARTGSATVELALVLPVAIAILGLAVFGGEGMSVKRKVTLATRDVGDLVAQTVLNPNANSTGVATIDLSTLNYYLSLSSLVVYPYDPTQLEVEVSEIQVQVNPAPTTTGNPPTTTGTVMWSQAYNGGTARACGSNVTVSANVVQALIPPTPVSNPQYSYLILAEFSIQLSTARHRQRFSRIPDQRPDYHGSALRQPDFTQPEPLLRRSDPESAGRRPFPPDNLGIPALIADQVFDSDLRQILDERRVMAVLPKDLPAHRAGLALRPTGAGP